MTIAERILTLPQPDIILPHTSDFSTGWRPREYLKEYYAARYLHKDQTAAVDRQVKLMRAGKAVYGPTLEFGCGPTVMRAVAAAPYVPEIHMAEYLPNNLREVRLWRQDDPHSFDWDTYTAHILGEEGTDPTPHNIHRRNTLTRQRITRLFAGVDAGVINPLGEAYRGYYANVISGFCADSATDDKTTWKNYMRNIATLVAPGGFFFVAALRKAQSYRAGNTYFPSANIDEKDMFEVLSLDFPQAAIVVDVEQLPSHQGQGYSGVILAHARKA